MHVRSARNVLAVDGGEPIRRTPLPRWPHFDGHDQEAAAAVLRSGHVNYWTGGQGSLFEHEFGDWLGAPYAVALANGTVALEIALRAWGITSGDEVIVPAATFIATASAVVACGAVPVVVDVDPNSQCLTTGVVGAALTERTKAIVVVHLAGFPADVPTLLDFTRSRGLGLIEDCAQAHGATIGGRKVGTFGHLATWSFCQDKIMTTAGEGGAITTGDQQLWQRCWSLKDHGKSYQAVHERQHPPGFRWLHEAFGTNARMTEVQAAIGRSQLHKLDAWVRTRQSHAKLLRHALEGLPALRLPEIPDAAGHAYYRFYAHIRIDQLAEGWTRDRVVMAINAEGVPCFHGGCAEIHRERAFEAVGRPDGSLPVAAELGATSLAFPVHPTLSEEDVSDMARAVTRVFQVASRSSVERS